MLDPAHITNSIPSVLERSEQPTHGAFDPPSGFAVSAIGRNKLIVLSIAVVLALIGAGVGQTRKATYTAAATLQVGQVNPNSPGFFGYVQSSASLATAFSRAISAEQVLGAVQHKLKLAPATALQRLSSEPIPQSPAFRVIATGPTEYAAVQLANVAASAVIAYEGQSNSANPEADSLLAEYREASIRLHHAVEALAHLSHRSHVSKQALADAEATRNAAATTFRALGVAYTSTLTSQAPRNGLVSLISGATGASSDHSSKIEQFGFIGLLAGVVIGCLFAVLLERLRLRRRLSPLPSEREQPASAR
jgi:capsular polysaccharide biosynthesis protein